MNTDRFRSTHPHLTEFKSFLEELNKESDRGAALVAVAMLDDLLEKIILAFLIEGKDINKLLSGFNAPLGTLSSRILAAYSLGLISQREYEESDRLRRVRNEFAHNVHQRFQDQKVRDICSALTFAANEFPGGHPNPPKAQFLTSATGLIVTLTNRPHYASLKRLQTSEWTI